MMKLKAKIEIEIDVKDDEQPSEACDRAIMELVKLVDGWVNGEQIAPVHYEFTHGTDIMDVKPNDKFLN